MRRRVAGDGRAAVLAAVAVEPVMRTVPSDPARLAEPAAPPPEGRPAGGDGPAAVGGGAPTPSPPAAAVAFLEPGQIAAGARRPVQRAPLSRSAQVLLCALRLFVLVLGAAVVYAFIAHL